MNNIKRIASQAAATIADFQFYIYGAAFILAVGVVLSLVA